MRVWIDDPNPVFRLGLVRCLAEPDFVVAGESSGFVPRPDLDNVDILVFDLGDRNLSWALGQQRTPTRLLGLIGAGGTEGEVAPGLCTVLVRCELTPEAFVEGLRSLWHAGPPAQPAARPASVAGGLSERERDVLRLLAQGEDDRGIARDLGASRRAARSFVANLVGRMGARSPAQAVARALREGVI